MNHVFCELLSPSGTSPEEQLRPAKIDFGLLCEKGSLLLKLSYGNGDFVAGLGGAQEAPRKGKRTKRILRELILATRKCCKKRGFDGSLVQNHVFSCVFSYPCFQNPIFCMLFGKNLQSRRQSTGPRRDQIKPKRPQKHRVLETGCLKSS